MPLLAASLFCGPQLTAQPGEVCIRVRGVVENITTSRKAIKTPNGFDFFELNWKVIFSNSN
jgi:hypothetical protein